MKSRGTTPVSNKVINAMGCVNSTWKYLRHWCAREEMDNQIIKISAA